jgi:UDP-glucose 4-epimerase
MRRRALVTGGAGFLGHHLIKLLLKEGWAIAAIDNFFAGKREHIEPFTSDANFILYEGDITDLHFVKRVLRAANPEIVFHLAAIHFIPFCMAHCGETLKVNVVGTQTILDAIEEFPIKKLVFASTGDVYLNSDNPHQENDPVSPRNIYGISKLFGEQLISLVRIKNPSSEFITARLFNIYGPGETNPHLFPDILACLRKARILRLGNMEPKRDYIFVGEVAKALHLLALYEGRETTFNVGTGTGTNVWDIVKNLENLLGSPLQVETDPLKLRKVDRPNLVANVSRLKQELGWAPSVPLERGLEITLRYESII